MSGLLPPLANYRYREMGHPVMSIHLPSTDNNFDGFKRTEEYLEYERHLTMEN